ncbi:MAG: AMP-binding protein [Bacteroidales bacterium]|nr:AMP-binding protein [Bacteroidales bacterium]
MPVTSEYYQPELVFPDLLNRAVRNHPDSSIGYIDKNGILTIQTYKDLHTKAKMIAAGLFNLGLKQGDTLIISTQYNQETIELLWGCFMLGVVPTVLQPPMTFSGYNPSVVKLTKVFEQLNSPFIFMSSGMKDSGTLPVNKIKHLPELDCTGSYPDPILKADDLAFIQFSSGSTGDPKGIMLTHNNLMVNMDAIRIGLDLHPLDNVGNWMPLFHDMGLIGYHFTPLYAMTFQYHVETNDFIMNPGLWLNMMSEQKIAISGCTNFALALVVRYIARKKPVTDWDFSTMKSLLNGAEPISVKIMKDYLDALKPFGFKPEAMMPVYGMAEATLAISFTPLMKPKVISAFDATLLDRENKVRIVDPSNPSARILTEVGIALNDVEIRIVDDEDNLLEDGNAGHIQVKGANITKGYYNNQNATATVFYGDWLRTGDIGFFYKGRLYINGRYKDIIFKNSRNYFANDLEEMACHIDNIKFGKIIFGGTTGRDTGQDKVIAFVASLSEEKAKETFRDLRAFLRSNLGITVDEMVLIRSNEIPKTSSGKIQRFKLMQRYLNGEFEDCKINA